MRQPAQQAVLVVGGHEDASLQEVHALQQHFRQHLLVALHLLQLRPQVEENELLRVHRVGEEHLELVALVENRLAVGDVAADGAERTLVPREVVLQTRFHILQVVHLLEHVDHADERRVQAFRHEFAPLGGRELGHVAAKHLDRVLLELHEVGEALHHRFQGLEGHRVELHAVLVLHGLDHRDGAGHGPRSVQHLYKLFSFLNHGFNLSERLHLRPK
mmetsp:Transcript_52462/g.105122  ORF Transcript_52462/g.105122 Transcript_52462/m.105122 type:complete len:217 (-) Transcript_52462:225-875(-)